jgi:hypothetical protein
MTVVPSRREPARGSCRRGADRHQWPRRCHVHDEMHLRRGKLPRVTNCLEGGSGCGRGTRETTAPDLLLWSSTNRKNAKGLRGEKQTCRSPAYTARGGVAHPPHSRDLRTEATEKAPWATSEQPSSASLHRRRMTMPLPGTSGRVGLLTPLPEPAPRNVTNETGQRGARGGHSQSDHRG